MSRTNYLFVAHNMEVGGIETLLLRMASTVAALGNAVVVEAPPGPIVDQLHPAIIWVPFCEGEAITDLVLEKLDIASMDHLNIWVSTPDRALGLVELQKKLWRRYRISSSAISGIFHPAQLVRDPKPTVHNLVARLIQHCTPPGAVYFMNDATRDAHVKRWGQHLRGWPVHRLALLQPSQQWYPRHRDGTRLSIVSVGRLVSFKAYNWGAIQTCVRLRERGVDVSWDIWGSGEDRAELQAAIEAAEIGDAITLRGELPYANFFETVARYDVFVGMGTAALEAAQLSMPTILSVVSLMHGTYGFLSTAPSDSVGEMIPDVPVQSLMDNLLAYSTSSMSERITVGNACRNSVAARASNISAPYDGLFAAGYRVPHRSARNLGYETLARLRRLKQKARAMFW